MTRTVDAIYEDGLLRLEEPVDLRERTQVRVRIELPEPAKGPIAAMQRLIELTESSADTVDEEELQHFMDRVRERE